MIKSDVLLYVCLPMENFLYSFKKRLVILIDDKYKENSGPDDVSERLSYYHPAHYQKGGSVEQIVNTVELEGDIVTCVDNSCPEAEIIAHECGNSRTLYSPDRNKEEVEDEV